MRTFGKIVFTALVAMVAARGFCGTGATEKWVANYVSNYVERTASAAVSITTTNGATTYASGGYRLVVEDSTEKALAIVEQTALSAAGGYTNGTVLARVEGQNLYKAGSREISFDDDAFHCTCGGQTYSSRDISGRTWLAREVVTTNMENVAISVGPRVTTNIVQFCVLARTYIQPSRVARIIGGE